MELQAMSRRKKGNKPTILQPPKGGGTHNNPVSIYWLDEEGIVNSIQKWNDSLTIEDERKILHEFQRIFGPEKKCFIIDITNAAPTDKARREMAAEELPKIAKAIAILSNSPLGNMLGNLFIALKRPPYPMKIFSNVPQAKEWLAEYMEKDE